MQTSNSKKPNAIKQNQVACLLLLAFVCLFLLACMCLLAFAWLHLFVCLLACFCLLALACLFLLACVYLHLLACKWSKAKKQPNPSTHWRRYPIALQHWSLHRIKWFINIRTIHQNANESISLIANFFIYASPTSKEIVKILCDGNDSCWVCLARSSRRKLTRTTSGARRVLSYGNQRKGIVWTAILGPRGPCAKTKASPTAASHRPSTWPSPAGK